jgi:DNA-binding transcriptional MerR regulator
MQGVKDAIKRSSLSREQIYYIEEQGYLGSVGRSGQSRAFTPEQLLKLERIAACRRIGLTLAEGSAIANAELSGSHDETTRLRHLAAAKARDIEREIAALAYILEVLFELASPRPGDAAA